MLGDTPEVTPTEAAYASMLSYGAWIALAVLLVMYALYVFDAVTSRIPLEELPAYWGLSTKEYVEQTGIPTGWGWTRMLSHGEFLPFIGITALAGLTILCFTVMLPLRVKARDIPYAVICLLEIIVLVLAASGILTSGGH
jgi:hypothetical protein